jgi:hypothetical protein
LGFGKSHAARDWLHAVGQQSGSKQGHHRSLRRRLRYILAQPLPWGMEASRFESIRWQRARPDHGLICLSTKSGFRQPQSTQAKGANSLSRSRPLLSDLRRPDIGAQVTATQQSQNPLVPASRSPLFPSSSVVTFAVRAFSVHPAATGRPIAPASTVAGTPDGPCPLSPTGRSLLR